MGVTGVFTVCGCVGPSRDRRTGRPRQATQTQTSALPYRALAHMSHVTRAPTHATRHGPTPGPDAMRWPMQGRLRPRQTAEVFWDS